MEHRSVPGFFIAFDGIDGCGKSTQLDRAAQRLAAEGRTVVTTREPGGTAIAETIRALILSPEYIEMVPECELLLYAAARAQHVREKILPALAAGAIVLCDRFDLATYAYQGFGRSISLPLLKTINEAATGGLAPRLTFLFDISVDAAFGRLAAMKKVRDRLESDDREFFSRVSEGYRVLAKQAGDRVVILDAERPVEELAGAVHGKIVALLGQAMPAA
jgi:dTMP kinase